MKKNVKTILSLVLALVFCAVTMTAAVAAPAAGGTPPDMPSGGAPGGPGGADTMTYDYSGTLTGTLIADGSAVSAKDGETYNSDTPDKNAALAQNGGTLNIKGATFNKSGDDTNGDNCNFYGLNSIVLAVGDKTKAYIEDSTLKAGSEGSNGLFATDKATVYAINDTIKTTAGNSRGLDATYGGTIIADNLSISTKGEHCAPLATDRGGGNISVTNSTLKSAGSGSPLLYSTGSIEVDNVVGNSTGSQIAGMEGLNTIRIYNSKLTSEITGRTASDPIADGIIIYQSTSGDAEASTGEAARFEAVSSALKSSIHSGSMFYITNTTADVVLSETTLNFDSSKANLLQIEGNDSNGWGTAGTNGGKVNFTCLEEKINGNISVDTISSLNLFLLKSTKYTGAISIKDNAVNTSQTDAPASVNLDSTSTWVVTGDSTVTNLNAESGSKIVDKTGKAVTIKANGKNVVKGSSDITVTVTGSYTNTVDTTDANSLTTSDAIDRSDFDKYYKVNTELGTNGSDAEASADQSGSYDTSAASATGKDGWPTWKVAVCAAAAILLLSILGYFITRFASTRMKELNDKASDKGDSQSKNNDTEEK